MSAGPPGKDVYIDMRVRRRSLDGLRIDSTGLVLRMYHGEKGSGNSVELTSVQTSTVDGFHWTLKRLDDHGSPATLSCRTF